jgi:HK97 family phage portal protein
MNRLLEKFADRIGFMPKEKAKALIATFNRSSGIPFTKEWSYQKLVDSYKSWVYTSVDKIAKSVAMIPLHLYVYRRSGKKICDPSFRLTAKEMKAKGELNYYLKQVGVEREQIFEHTFLTLINRPNPIMTRFTLWYETIVRLEIGGSCGWYLPMNGLRLPGRIWPLPLTKTASLKPRVEPTMDITAWEYRDGSVTEIFLPEEVILHKYPHPAGPFQGMSPLMAQTYPYEIDEFLMQQQKALFENMAVLGHNLTTDQNLSTEQVKELKEMLREYAGTHQSGQSMVLHSGLKVDKMGMTTREAMINVVAQFAREKLITSFDLSEGKLGLVRDVNRANMEALNETYVAECLRPKTMLIEENLESFLLPRYDEGLTCDFDLPDVQDKEFKLKERESNLTNLLTTINEERTRMGLEDKPWGDVPFVPFSLAPYGVEPKPLPTDGGDGNGKSVKVFWTPEKQQQYWKIFVRRSEKFEPILLGPIKMHFRKIENEVISRLRKDGQKIVDSYAGWSRQRVGQNIKDNARVREINIDKAKETAILREAFRPLLQYILRTEGNERMRELRYLKIEIEFNVNDPRVKKWLGSRLRRFSEEVSGTTFDEISAILREGFVEGEPMAAIAETLRNKFDAWDRYRAPMIARTETISSMNHADVESVRQLGLEDAILKHWLTAGDEVVRDTHRAAGKDYEDGIEIDEAFKVGDDSMLSPGDGSDPGENINCRCTIYYSKKED